MIEDAPAPTRVAVFGNSAGVLVAGTTGTTGPFVTYPAALGRSTTYGRFDVSNHCRIAGVLTQTAGAWLEPLSKSRPDVVVIQFGAYEAFPRWLPRRLIAAMMGIGRHAGWLRTHWWHQMAGLLAALSSWEGRLDEIVPLHWGGYVNPRRFEDELRLICRRISRQIGCRIVLMDAYCPSSKSVVITDKMRRRTELNNDAMRRVAADMHLDVFPLADLVRSLDGEKVLGDGLHMDATTHVRVGEALAEFLSRPHSG